MGDDPENDIEKVERFPEEGLPAPGKTKERLDRLFDDLANIDGQIVSNYETIKIAEQNIAIQMGRRHETIKKLQDHCIFVLESGGFELPPGKNPSYDRATGKVSIVSPSQQMPPPPPKEEDPKSKKKSKKKK